jgi:hypothetical protein
MPRPSLFVVRVGLRAAPRGLVLAPWALCVLGCFDGASALHLPCERDEDCGLGQSCVAAAGSDSSFCDGPPETFGDTASTGDAPTGSGSTDATGSDSGGSSSGPPIPVCGNAIVETGEACDEGEDTLACNSAPTCRGPACCTAPTCGDGHVNTAAFETCEGGATCSDACVDLLLVQDFQSSPGGDIFAGEPEGLEPVPDPPTNASVAWRFDAANQWWETGDYGADGGAVLATTVALDLPADVPPGTEVQLRFRHFHDFDDGSEGGCGFTPRGDGGMVFVFEEGSSSMQQVLPIGGADGLLLDVSRPACNPFSQDGNDRPAYVGRSAPTLREMEPATFSLASWHGASIRIVFVGSYDCGNCWGAAEPTDTLGWRIDDLEVGVHPAGSVLDP